MFRALLLPAATFAGLYKPNGDVVVLNSGNFRKKVIESSEPWIVEFYADWCGHCKAFAPEVEKAATALKGIVNVGAVDDQSLMGTYGVQGFPTVKFFGEDKNKAEDYNAARTAAGLVDYAVDKIKKITRDRLNGKSKKSSSGSSERRKSSSSGSKDDGAANVVVLTDKNFSEMVEQDEESVWFIEFYAPWCGHCKNLEPIWEQVGKELKGKVKVGKVDATAENVLSVKFGVKGFPTLKLFPVGPKSENTAVEYKEGRTASEITKFALGYYMKSVEVGQLLSDKAFHKSCDSTLCVIAFVPHILDSGLEARKDYLEGGDQFELEEALRLQFGFPAMVAVHLEKKKYSIFRGSFTKSAIGGFLTSLTTGRAALDDLPQNMPAFKTVKKWNGKMPEDEL